MSGRVEITSSTNSEVYIETYTQCVGPDGTATLQGHAAQNHEGKDTPAGVSYPSPGHLTLFPLLLFQAPTTGTYRCQLLGSSGTSKEPSPPMTAVATDFEGSSTTWLAVSAADDAGASWWQNSYCDIYGNPQCNYLAGASQQTQLYVFDNDGSPEKVWQAASDAAFVDASDSLMLTTCYASTDSCTTGNKSGDSGDDGRFSPGTHSAQFEWQCVQQHSES